MRSIHLEFSCGNSWTPISKLSQNSSRAFSKQSISTSLDRTYIILVPSCCSGDLPKSNPEYLTPNLAVGKFLFCFFSAHLHISFGLATHVLLLLYSSIGSPARSIPTSLDPSPCLSFHAVNFVEISFNSASSSSALVNPSMAFPGVSK